MILEKDGVYQDTRVTLATELVSVHADAAQELLNEFFSVDRREALLQTASVDTKGRKVRYYREMYLDKLIALLEKGHLDVFDHFAKPGSAGPRRETLLDSPDSASLRYLLSRHAAENQGVGYFEFKDLMGEDWEGDFSSNLNLRLTTLQKLFPQAPPENVIKVAENWNYQNFLPFLEQNLPRQFMQRLHTGSYAQKYSPYLSASVGGCLTDHLFEKRVIIEMIIPDLEVLPNEFGVTGEKEVFLRRLKLEEVSRVFTTTEQLEAEVITHPDTALGDYYTQVYTQLSDSEKYLTKPVDRWRNSVPTKDCLPGALAVTYVHQGK